MLASFLRRFSVQANHPYDVYPIRRLKGGKYFLIPVPEVALFDEAPPEELIVQPERHLFRESEAAHVGWSEDNAHAGVGFVSRWHKHRPAPPLFILVGSAHEA